MNKVSIRETLSGSAALRQTEVVRRRAPLGFVPLAVVAFTIVANLALLEVGLRLVGRYQLDTIDGYFSAEGISYGLKKNASKRVFWPTHSFLVQTDEYGFRADRTGPRDLTRKPYYAVLGSSDTFGNGLDYDKTFVGIFAQRMMTHQMDVVNLAVGGHHWDEQAARFKDFVSRAPAPPRAVIITLNPLLIRGFDDSHAGAIIRKGELFSEDNWRLPLAKMVLANSSAAYCFLRDGIRNIQLKYLSRADFSLDFYLSVYSTSLPIMTPAKTAEFEARVADLGEYIRSIGAKPICVYSPTSGGFMLDKLKREGRLDGSGFDTQFFRNLARKHCTAAGIPLVDFEPLLQRRYDRGEKLNFDLDAHFNEATSLAVGEYLYASLKPGAAVSRLPDRQERQRSAER